MHHLAPDLLKAWQCRPRKRK